MNLKKWLIIIGILLLLIAIATTVLYNNAQKPYDEKIAQAKEAIDEQALFTTVDKVYVYRGTDVMYTATGTDESGRPIAAFVTESGEAEPVVIPLSENATESKAREQFQKEAPAHTLYSVTLGMESGIPVWLFLFESENGRLNYYYLSAADGKWWKKVENI